MAEIFPFHTKEKEPNHNGVKPSFSLQLVKFYLFLSWEIVVDPD